MIQKECWALEDQSTGSNCAFHLARSWPKTCSEEHELCKKSSKGLSNLPTRLIDVGDSTGTELPFLYISKPGERGQYVTVSHSWGSKKQCTTVESNLDARQNCIPLSEMSQTFRDAITITHKLGCRYFGSTRYASSKIRWKTGRLNQLKWATSTMTLCSQLPRLTAAIKLQVVLESGTDWPTALV